MKLATFTHAAAFPHVGIVHDGDRRMFDLTAAARQVGDRDVFDSMLALMAAGPEALDGARALLQRCQGDSALDLPIGAVKLLPPVPEPASVRDFVAFPGHIRNAPVALRALADRMGIPLPGAGPAGASAEVPAVYRRFPNFYKGNRFTVVGTDADIRRPRDCEYLDYELELGLFIGRSGTNIPATRAVDHIFGYCIFNDFSARDIQVREIGGMTGPCKSKDFATGNAIGPWIVTADEIPDPYALAMSARVNGETWCASTSAGMLHSFEDMIAYVSRDEPLRPGEFFGSGTVGGGTGMELDRFLQDGDVIELDVESIGSLRNRIVPARPA